MPVARLPRRPGHRHSGRPPSPVRLVASLFLLCVQADMPHKKFLPLKICYACEGNTYLALLVVEIRARPGFRGVCR